MFFEKFCKSYFNYDKLLFFELSFYSVLKHRSSRCNQVFRNNFCG